MNDLATMSSVKPIRRIVTANVDGKSVIQEDGYSPHVMPIHGIRGHAVTDLWKTRQSPARASLPDPCSVPVQLAPPERGTVFRTVEFPPDAQWLGSADNQAAFASMGESGAAALLDDGARHPFMHRTRSVDYAIVLEGEIWALLDQGETLMKAGDVLVQRGTNHAWSNRSEAQCVIAFVLIDAEAE